MQTDAFLSAYKAHTRELSDLIVDSTTTCLEDVLKDLKNRLLILASDPSRRKLALHVFVILQIKNELAHRAGVSPDAF